MDAAAALPKVPTTEGGWNLKGESKNSPGGGWIREMWYIQKMEYYSAVKRNKILKSVGKWMEVENIKLSEFAQAQKAKY